MEMKDIEEMPLAEIEKMVREKEERLLINLSKIQKLSEENSKLAEETKMLNQQKFQKLFEEIKVRMFAQVEQAKMLSVENLLTPLKGKPRKKRKSQKNLALTVEALPYSPKE